jgi:NADH:ubiquinone oxidoreductase subunit F (NADH-binding)
LLSGVIAEGLGPAGVATRIGELEQVMRRTSICGLGQVALGPVTSVLRLAAADGTSRGSRDDG